MKNKLKLLGKMLLLLAVLLIKIERTNAQTTFQLTVGTTSSDYANSIVPTSDGNLAVAGTFGSAIGLTKIDTLGSVLWQKSFSTASGDVDHANCMKATSDGGFIIAGSIFPANYPATPEGGYLMKTDGDGNVSWSHLFYYSGDAKFYSVTETSAGGFVAAGYNVADGAYVIKTDKDGNLSWSKKYSGGGANAIQKTSDGGLIFCGNKNQDVWLAKTDSDGNLSWAKTYGGTGDDFGYDVKQTSDGGFILSGGTNSFGTYFEPFVIKTLVNGDTSWTRCYGTNSGNGEASSVISLGNEYIFSGWKGFNNGNNIRSSITSIDQTGSINWSNVFGSNSASSSLLSVVPFSGNLISCGNVSSGTDDWLIVKASSGGKSCSDSSVNITAKKVATIVTDVTASTTVGSPATIVGNPSVTVGSGGTVSMICSANPPVVNLGPANDTLCTGDTLHLDAGNAGSSFSWSTGETTQMISATTTGTYSVTVTNSAGMDSGKVNIVFLPKATIGGKVTWSGGSASSVKVEAISYSSQSVLQSVLDSTMTDASGNYTLSNIPQGSNVMVLAIPDTTIEHYAVPTYADSMWDYPRAVIVQNTNCGKVNTGLDIKLYEIPQIAGTWGGHIFFNLLFGRTGKTGVAGDPASGVTVYLARVINSSAVLMTITDSLGAGEFKNVPDGNFLIKVVKPTLNQDSTVFLTIAKATGDTLYEGLKLCIDSVSIGICAPLMLKKISTADYPIKIFPNPSNGNLEMRMANAYDFTNGELFIYNLLGEKIYSQKILNANSQFLNLNLENGIYFLQVKTKDKNYFQKVVIEK